MASAQLNTVVRHLKSMAATCNSRELTDTQMLEKFINDSDPDAFCHLLRRHGPMVLGVCRHVLNHEQDAEDAFQVTFLALARKAASVRKKQALASWLHGVAFRTALTAKRAAARRRAHEGEAQAMSQKNSSCDPAWSEVQAILDEEVQGLPENYRAPFVLCCLEGKSRADAACELGLKEGTVSSRVERGRKQLRERLARRGIALPAVLATTALSGTVGAAVPARLVHATVEAAVQYASSKTVAAGLLSAGATALLQGVNKTMLATQCKTAMALVLTAGLFATATGMLTFPGAAAQPGEARQQSTPRRATDDEMARLSFPPFEKFQPVTFEEDAEGAVEMSGRVLDPDGKPLPGAKLYLSYYTRKPYFTSEPSEPKARATSGTDGRFRLTFLKSEIGAPPGFHGEVEPWRSAKIIAVADGFGPAWAKAGAVEKGELSLRLVKDDVPIQGRLLDLQGRPIAGATIRLGYIRATPGEDLSPFLKPGHFERLKNLPAGIPALWRGPRTTTTGTDGRFRLAGVGRERIASLSIEGPTIEHTGVWVLTRPGLDPKALAAGDPEHPYPIYGATFEHVAAPSRPISGTVRDKATGKPLAGVEVYCITARKSWGVIGAVTDARGRYQLVGLPKAEQYVFRARPRDGEPYLDTFRKVGDTEGLKPITVDLELIHGVVIQGGVTEKQGGKPVVGATVQYHSTSGYSAFLAEVLGRSEYNATTTTAVDGNFSLVGLPGKGEIRVEVPDGRFPQVPLDYGGCASREIEPAKSAKTFTCDFALVPGRTLKGSVIGPDGKPLPGAKVSGLTAPHTAATHGNAKLLDKNEFTAIGLDPQRPRQLYFLQNEHKLAGSLVARGDEAEPVTVRLQPWGTVVGQVLDIDGKPLVGAAVHLLYPRTKYGVLYPADRPSDESLMTDAEGRFRIEGLIPDMSYLVNVVKGGLPFAQRTSFEVSVRADETKDLGKARARKVD